VVVRGGGFHVWVPCRLFHRGTPWDDWNAWDLPYYDPDDADAAA
jgi:hypothetical protein